MRVLLPHAAALSVSPVVLCGGGARGQHLLRVAGKMQMSTTSARLLTLNSATTQDWKDVIEVLSPIMKESRYTRMEQVVMRRRDGVHLVLENLSDPLNCGAVMRTAEGLGVQHIHIVESVNEFRQPGAETTASARGALKNVAMGASRWLSVSKYKSSRACFERLKELGLRVLASDCPESETVDEDERDGFTTIKTHEFQAEPLDQLAFSRGEGVALVFGNERRGVSRAFLEHADSSFYLPMCGFTQSFNISVAAAISMQILLATGAFPEGSLPEDLKMKLLGRWLLRDVKGSKPVLRRNGIEFKDF